MDFTVEEINLMCIYDTSSRDKLRRDLLTGLREVDDPEMIAIFASTIIKLEMITDDEFLDIGFYIADNK